MFAVGQLPGSRCKVKIFQSEQIERAMEAFLDTDTAAAIDRALSGELSVDREHRRCGAYGIITVKKTPKK